MDDTARGLQPLWYRTAPPLPDGAVIRSGHGFDSQVVDVAVVGAGVSGLSTAVHLAERGVSVTVLERAEPGAEASGRANGQVIAGLHESPTALMAAHGHACGERMIAFSGGAPDRLFDLVARHGIACDAERTGWVQASRSARGLKALEEVASAWAARGAPVRMLNRAETAGILGTDVYAGALLDGRNGTIQPLSYVRGLAATAARLGARIHCGVAVSGIERGKDVWRIATDAGELRASHVVLAANVLASKIEGAASGVLGQAYLTSHSVQLATGPLDGPLRQSILPQRHSCSDTSHLRLRYFRLDRDSRFVIGGPGWLTAPDASDARSFRWLEASARRMFPQLASVPFEHHWAARDSLTADVIPHLFEPSPGLYAVVGFNGRGLAIGTALGGDIARRIVDGAEASDSWPITPPTSLPYALGPALRLFLRLATGK